MASLDHQVDTPLGPSRCSACGGPVRTGAAFCGHCGVAMATPHPETPAPPPASGETAAVWHGTSPTGTGPTPSPTPDRRRRRTTIVIVAIAAGMLLLAVAVTVVVMLARLLTTDGDVPLFGDEPFEA